MRAAMYALQLIRGETQNPHSPVAGRAIDKIRPDARRFRVHVTQLTAHRCGKELS